VALLLRDKNQASIRAAGVAHGLVFAAVALGPELAGATGASALTAGWLRAAVAVLASVTALILTETGSRKAKMWLIHRGVPPGQFAFSRLGPAEPLVDMERIGRVLGAIPVSPADQDRVWFTQYKIHEANTRVRAVHGRALLMRDLAWMTTLLLFIATTAMWLVTRSWTSTCLYCAGLLIAVAVLIHAARQTHYTFTTTVLTCIGDPEPKSD
jgi:hypothetical protein